MVSRMIEWFGEIGRRVRMLMRRNEFDSEMDEEMRLHREMKERELVEAGESREEAYYAAQRKVGNTLRLREESRDVWGWNWLERFLQDVRFGLRMFRRAPVFSLTVILMLALGIGANTAVFTLVHAVLLKSLPVTKPEQLFRVGDNEQCCVNDGLEGSWSLFPYDLYKHLRDNTPAFQELAAFQAGYESVGVRRINADGPAESRTSEFVSGNYFQMFGIGAYAGRMFTADDDRRGGSPVVVMSYRAWKEKYGGDWSVIGAAVAINGQPFTIVAIAPPGFFGDALRSNPPEIWIPLSFEPQVHGTNSLLDHWDDNWLNATGRLAPGAQSRLVETQMTTELRQWLLRPGTVVSDAGRVEVDKQVIRLAPGGSGVQRMREAFEEGLKLLLWVTACVLLVACANLANLLLARATARRQEFSIRAALGASQARLVRQAFSETLLLSVLGGAAGLFVAIYGTRFILHLAFPNRYVPIDAAPDWPVLGFAFAASVVTGFLSGMVPAWLTSRTQPVEALRAASRATATHGHWLQPSLVILQSALSLVLICAAGLVVQSLRNMRNQHFGFVTKDRYIAEFDPQMAGYKPAQLDALYHQIRDDLQQIPGVQSVSYAMYTPMSGRNWQGRVNVEGRHADNDQAVFTRVGPDYFDALGTRIVQGRPITEQDTASSHPVALVNEEFVKRYLDGKNPLGRHFGSWGASYQGALEIVGVTENTNYWSPDEAIQAMYFVAAPQAIKRDTPEDDLSEQRSLYMRHIILHTSGPVLDLDKQVRRTLGQINPDLPVMDFFPLALQVQTQLDQQQMIAQLMTIFGFLALTLATIGLYGVNSYHVERRTNEIGIRMALGADRLNVVRMVMRTVALQSAAGLIIGIPLTLAAGRVLGSKLFGVRTFDLPVFAFATLALVLSALIGGFFPARRAASIEPIQALRSE
jgi:putative ABC transport system permease protein